MENLIICQKFPGNFYLLIKISSILLSGKEERLWYAKKICEYGWSRNILSIQIDTQAHMRHGKAQNNFLSRGRNSRLPHDYFKGRAPPYTAEKVVPRGVSKFYLIVFRLAYFSCYHRVFF